MESLSRPASAGARLLLAALLAASLGLRLWYAGPRPDSSRWYDERFGLKNVTALLRDGSLRPRHAYYPSLAYLPQAAAMAASEGLHRLTGIEALSIYGRTADGYSPTAYYIARGCASLFGILGGLAVYLAARRLRFPPAAGILAAAILLAFPRHLLSSIQFKPDTLAVFLVAATLCWTIPAARRPTRRRFLGVGASVGLAVSAKYTGVGAALPLVASVLDRVLRGWVDRRAEPREPETPGPWRLIGWLVLAGLASVAVFVALNPFLPMIFRFMPKLVYGYAGKGTRIGSGHLTVLRQQLELLLAGHGWIVAALLAGGTVALALRLRRRHQDSERLAAVLLLGGFLGYTALHAGFMTLFRPQNYLPALPFSSLIAGWAAVELWRAVSRRLPARAVRPAAAAALLAAVLLLLARQADWAYRHTLPTTWEVAEALLRQELAPLGLRQVIYEPGADGHRLILQEYERAIATPVTRLADAVPSILDRSDAEVFPRSRLAGPDAEPYLRRGLAVGSERIRMIEPRRFESHGEALVIYLHPWREAAPAEELPLARFRRRLAATLPSGPGTPPGMLSVVLWVPVAERGRVAALHLTDTPTAGVSGDLILPLHFTAQHERQTRLASLRFPAPANATRVELPLPPGSGPSGGYRLQLHRWASPWAPVR